MVGGCWGQWMLAGAGIRVPATSCSGLPGGWCLHREPRDPLEPKGRRYVSPVPRGIPHAGGCSGWHDGPGTPVPTSRMMCHMLSATLQGSLGVGAQGPPGQDGPPGLKVTAVPMSPWL